MKNINRLQTVVVLASLLGLMQCGCSGMPSLVPVKGTVELDGKPAEGVYVYFWSADKTIDASRQGYGKGLTDVNGAFVIDDLFGKQGLFPGEYKVTFSRYVDAKGNPIGKNAKPDEVYGGAKDLMPKRYQDPSTTPVSVKVPSSGVQDLKFELSSK